MTSDRNCIVNYPDNVFHALIFFVLFRINGFVDKYVFFSGDNVTGNMVIHVLRRGGFLVLIIPIVNCVNQRRRHHLSNITPSKYTNKYAKRKHCSYLS